MSRALAVALAAVALAACCTVAYRDDGRVGQRRYYRAKICPWGATVTCDSATRLPDPVTWTEGCR